MYVLYQRISSLIEQWNSLSNFGTSDVLQISWVDMFPGGRIWLYLVILGFDALLSSMDEVVAWPGDGRMFAGTEGGYVILMVG